SVICIVKELNQSKQHYAIITGLSVTAEAAKKPNYTPTQSQRQYPKTTKYGQIQQYPVLTQYLVWQSA
ncbi:hypothetical protein, partial [Neisseria canis]|uniref:hypothetical protein n=1 Tax=Neisseria canis TaxID=493 RepID=UPI001B80BCA7